MAANWLIDSKAFRDCRIYAIRTRSGLGVRLGFLLRGYVLAELIGAKFRFQWPVKASDGINSAEETFDRSFLLQYYDSGYKPRSSIRLKEEVTLSDLTNLMRHCRHGVSVSLKPGSSDGITIKKSFTRKSLTFGEALEQVKFAPDIEALRHHVAAKYENFDLGIHVRRGDIKHGLARIGGWFCLKLIPLPLILAIIERLPVNYRVLLVDNENVCKEWPILKCRAISSTATEKLPFPENPKLRAFFDFFMSMRCRSVIAGTSNFAILAAEVSGSERLTWHDFIGDHLAKELIFRFISNGYESDPLEVALASVFALDSLRHYLMKEERDTLISHANCADPENPAFALKIISESLRQFKFERAAEDLMRAVQYGALKTTFACSKYWKIGHADIMFKNLVHPGGILEEKDLIVLETHSGRVPFLDWFLLAADLARQPENVDGRLALAKKMTEGFNEAWFCNAYYEGLFERARSATQSEMTPV